VDCSDSECVATVHSSYERWKAESAPTGEFIAKKNELRYGRPGTPARLAAGPQPTGITAHYGPFK
jgi:hypothetical protein